MFDIQTLIAAAVPIVLAITVHEAAHGFVAHKFGDDTAASMGRVTLNPLVHIDPIGTVLVPLLTYAMGGIMFGWAKPVPVRFDRLTHGRAGVFAVAGAGPLSNLLMAIMFALLAIGVDTMPSFFGEFAAAVAIQGISINLAFFALNLVPIPPLDGGRMLHSVLPRNFADSYSKVEPYGMYIVLGLMLTGLMGMVMKPFLSLGIGIISGILS